VSSGAAASTVLVCLWLLVSVWVGW
jgi:hypothetical protein